MNHLFTAALSRHKFANMSVPSSKRGKKHDSTLHESTPVAGTSLLFSHKVLCGRNFLQPLIISSRIPYIALHHGPEAPYYMDNSNLHSLPANCTGVLVAYSCSAGRLKGSSRPDEVLKATWRQGVIVLYHSLSTTVLLTRTLEHHCVSLHTSCLRVYSTKPYSKNRCGVTTFPCSKHVQ